MSRFLDSPNRRDSGAEQKTHMAGEWFLATHKKMNDYYPARRQCRVNALIPLPSITYDEALHKSGKTNKEDRRDVLLEMFVLPNFSRARRKEAMGPTKLTQ